MPASDSFQATWDAVPDNVALARHSVRDRLTAARTAEPPLNDVCLAVSEAMTNVVWHAYANEVSGPIHIELEIGDDEVKVVVEDEGDGMRPRPDSPGLGLGMPLIASLADRFEVKTEPGAGTRVCMWFSKAPSAQTLPA